MARANITNAFVERLSFATDGTLWFFDEKLSGFQLAVGKQSKTFYAEASHANRLRRIKLGRADTLNANDARRRARDEVLPMLRQGVDPRPPRSTPVIADERQTFRGVWMDYKLHGTQAKVRTLVEYERTLNRHVPDWWDRACTDISTKDVSERWRNMTSSGVEAAKATFRIVSAIMHHAVRMEVIAPDQRPTLVLPKGWAAVTRNPQRIGDLDRWWRRVDELDMIPKSVLRTLLLTGFRPGEVKRLRWDDVNLAEGKVRLRDVKRGPDRDAAIPSQVVALLKRVQDVVGDPVHVFPSPTSGAGHVVTLPGSGDVGWRAKDCRNEWDSIAAEIGIPHQQRAAQMGHAAGSMTDSYVVTPDVRTAVQAVADEVYRRTKETRASR